MHRILFDFSVTNNLKFFEWITSFSVKSFNDGTREVSSMDSFEKYSSN
ncbi:hypothetical protein P689_122246 [Candidatus Riesia pediculischaeffi PTSU]|uniref:Uncharacterized protein n=1 Tax=Candidatus Riesia pediculischaeffi PTSU TaxID=1401651 RepID=A0A0C1V5R8_9ENTR|nr:hypothetical protein P689_122246 [Candidatus Riesia pediculischaeffi PTSU]